MTDAERKAMEWLDGQLGYSLVQPVTDTLAHLRTLKAMLTRPALPEEPNDAALYAMEMAGPSAHGYSRVTAQGMYRALYAHLTAKPTKIVWRVQPEGWPFEDFPAIYAATARASHWLAQDIEVSIRKTEVPA